jgi:hypothetical protein
VFHKHLLFNPSYHGISNACIILKIHFYIWIKRVPSSSIISLICLMLSYKYLLNIFPPTYVAFWFIHLQVCLVHLSIDKSVSITRTFECMVMELKIFHRYFPPDKLSYFITVRLDLFFINLLFNHISHAHYFLQNSFFKFQNC